ncbi:hypothetical protein C0Z16_03720 [Paraburkholderia rhynchosiae]|uniref:Uncharacterized protein n=1 Tax=Paraburkholderia rhynchosiae TaxID=487049 RepID=A0ABX4VB84_9BURK|nr:hypothetical protein C0Z16_03720 [Paraburkholderia rhynchosiae]
MRHGLSGFRGFFGDIYIATPGLIRRSDGKRLIEQVRRDRQAVCQFGYYLEFAFLVATQPLIATQSLYRMYADVQAMRYEVPCRCSAP